MDPSPPHFGQSVSEKKRLTAEEKLVQEFWHIVRTRLSVKALHQGEDLIRQQSWDLSKRGLGVGILAGLCTFVTLRQGPTFLTRYWMRRTSRTNPLDHMTLTPRRGATSSKAVGAHNSPFHRGSSSSTASNPNSSTYRYKSGMYYGWLMVDVTLSAGMAATVAQIMSSASASSSDPRIPLLETFPSLPLQAEENNPRASSFVREVCPLAIAYTRSTGKRLAPGSPQTAQWKAIVDFANACAGYPHTRSKLSSSNLFGEEEEKVWRNEDFLPRTGDGTTRK